MYGNNFNDKINFYSTVAINRDSAFFNGNDENPFLYITAIFI